MCRNCVVSTQKEQIMTVTGCALMYYWQERWYFDVLLISPLSLLHHRGQWWDVEWHFSRWTLANIKDWTWPAAKDNLQLFCHSNMTLLFVDVTHSMLCWKWTLKAWMQFLLDEFELNCKVSMCTWRLYKVSVSNDSNQVVRIISLRVSSVKQELRRWGSKGGDKDMYVCVCSSLPSATQWRWSSLWAGGQWEGCSTQCRVCRTCLAASDSS